MPRRSQPDFEKGCPTWLKDIASPAESPKYVRIRTDPRTNTASKLEIDPNQRPRGTRRLRRGKAVPCPGDVRAEFGEDHYELMKLLVKTDRRIDKK